MKNKESLRSKYDMYLKDGRRESDVYSLDYENRVLSAKDMIDTNEYDRIKDKLIDNYNFITKTSFGCSVGRINPIVLKWWKYFEIIKDEKELNKSILMD